MIYIDSIPDAKEGGMRAYTHLNFQKTGNSFYFIQKMEFFRLVPPKIQKSWCPWRRAQLIPNFHLCCSLRTLHICNVH